MGIYPSDIIYGVRIFHSKDNDVVYESDIIYEKKWETKLDDNKINDVRHFYYELEDTMKCNLRFYIFVECTSTLEYESRDEMYWFPIDYTMFCRFFNVELDKDLLKMLDY
jgi:hypothetical protein